jgi:hypothetical protein
LFALGRQGRNCFFDLLFASAVKGAALVRIAGEPAVRVEGEVADVVRPLLGDADDVATGNVAVDGELVDVGVVADANCRPTFFLFGSFDRLRTTLRQAQGERSLSDGRSW